jgi:DNA-binding transcriptional regulator YiaG
MEGRQIKNLRKDVGLTQEQFARRLGVSFSTVNRWENDKGKPSPLAMEKVKRVAGKEGLDFEHYEKSKIRVRR